MVGRQGRGAAADRWRQGGADYAGGQGKTMVFRGL